MESAFPFLSVIVPAHNRPRQLKRCLSALAKSRYPLDRIEMIVVDDGSRIPLKDITHEFREKLNLRFQRQQRRGSPQTGAAAGSARRRQLTGPPPHPTPLEAASSEREDRRFSKISAIPPTRAAGDLSFVSKPHDWLHPAVWRMAANRSSLRQGQTHREVRTQSHGSRPSRSPGCRTEMAPSLANLVSGENHALASGAEESGSHARRSA